MTMSSATGDEGTGGDSQSNSTLFVGNISITSTDNDILDIFSEYGNVVVVRIQRCSKTGTSLGYGFLAMSTEEEANLCIQEINGKYVRGRYMKVRRAGYGLSADGRNCAPLQKSNSAELNFFNIESPTFTVHFKFHCSHPSCTISELFMREVFENCGPIRDIAIRKVSLDKTTGLPCGYGFIHYVDDDAGLDAAMCVLKTKSHVSACNTIASEEHTTDFNLEASNNLLKHLEYIGVTLPPSPARTPAPSAAQPNPRDHSNARAAHGAAGPSQGRGGRVHGGRGAHPGGRPGGPLRLQLQHHQRYDAGPRPHQGIGRSPHNISHSFSPHESCTQHYQSWGHGADLYPSYSVNYGGVVQRSADTMVFCTPGDYPNPESVYAQHRAQNVFATRTNYYAQQPPHSAPSLQHLRAAPGLQHPRHSRPTFVPQAMSNAAKPTPVFPEKSHENYGPMCNDEFVSHLSHHRMEPNVSSLFPPGLPRGFPRLVPSGSPEPSSVFGPSFGELLHAQSISQSAPRQSSPSNSSTLFDKSNVGSQMW